MIFTYNESVNVPLFQGTLYVLKSIKTFETIVVYVDLGYYYLVSLEYSLIKQLQDPDSLEWNFENGLQFEPETSE